VQSRRHQVEDLNMLGLKPMELLLILGVLFVVVSVGIGIVYAGVRLANRHDRKN
jgi:hypothetical protein